MSEQSRPKDLRGVIRPVALMVLAGFRADPIRATASLVLRIAVGASPVMFALALASLIESAHPGGSRDAALVAAAMLAAAVALRAVVDELGWKISQVLEEKTSHLVDCEIIGIVAGLPGLEHFERSNYLDRIDRIRTEQWLLSQSIQAILNATVLAIQVVATVGLLVRVDIRMLALPLFAIPGMIAAAKAEKIWQREAEANEWSWRATYDLIQLTTKVPPAKEIRVFGLADELVRRNGELSRHIGAWIRHALFEKATRLIAARAVFVAGYSLAMLLVASRVVSGSATVADLVLTAVLAGQVMEQVQHVVNNGSWLAWTLTAVRRYAWLLDYAAKARPTTSDTPVPAPSALRKGIRFEHVSFQYPGSDDVVLHDVNLELAAGSTLAVVGDNGAGKTTLVKLLCGFYQPTEGRITVDGVDLREMDLNDWRSRIAAAFQDHAKLELHAQHVVGLGDLPRHDDEGAVRDALERGGSTDVLASLPDGLATQLGTQWWDGVDLSGGEWQKLALGRGMMREHPLLLALDEPTAALDAETEHRLFDRYASAAHQGAGAVGTITVLVSHRFSTVRMADVIAVVADGGIRELGTHDELFAAGGTYAELYELQARAYR